MDINELIEAATASENAGKARITELREKLQQAEDIDLAALETGATEAFEERYAQADEQYTQDVNDSLEAIADIADAVRAEKADADAAAAEQQDRAAQLAARVNGPDTGADDESDDAEDSEDEAEGEPAGDASDADLDTDTPDTTGGTTNEQEGRQPVAASRRTRPNVTARQVNAHRTTNTGGAPAAKPLRRMSLTAAADVPQVPSGASLDMRQLAEASIRRFQSMPLGSPNAVVRNGIGIIRTEADDAVTASGDRRDIDKIDAVADEKRLPGGSLLAATQQSLTAAAQQGTFSYGGAWCAPSETDYGICESLSSENAGVADFPQITVNHGGIMYPVYRSYPEWDVEFQDFDENADYEATPKTCVVGPCPEWTEERLRIAPLCVQGDILRERGYPELTQRFIDDVLVKFAHSMNRRRLNWIDNASTALTPFDASTEMGSASYTIADRIGLLVEWMRELYRMAEGTTLEGIAPMWLKGLLKSDIAKRSNRAGTSVTDAEVTQVFTDRGARIQWVYDWGGMSAGGDSATTPPAAFPDTASVLLYPAGSWVAANQDIITLDALYDSQNLRHNIYTALFTEQSYLMLNRCNPSYKIQLTGLCANGAVGPFRDTCPPAAESAPAA